MRQVKLFAVILSAALVLSLAGCAATAPKVSSTQDGGAAASSTKASEDKPATTISYLISQSGYLDVYKDIAAAIKTNENITLDYQVVPDDQYGTLAKTKLATNEVPDIIEGNVPSTNLDYDVWNQFTAMDEQPWMSRLVNPDLIKDAKDGKTYAQPQVSSGTFLAWYFNKTKLEELGIDATQPATYADFLKRCDEILEKSNGEIAPIAMSCVDSWTVQIYPVVALEMAIYPNQDEICEKLRKNELAWNEMPEYVKVLEDLVALKKYFNKDYLSANLDAAKEKVGKGEAIMVFNGEWVAQDIAAKYPDIEIGSWICNYNDTMALHTGAYVRGLYVAKQGKQVDETLRFLDIWSQPTYQDMYFKVLPGLPAFSDCNGGDMLDAVTSLMDTYIPSNKYVINMNDVLGEASTVFPDAWTMYVDMLAGGMSPQQVADKWQVVYADYMKQIQSPGF